MEWVILKRLDNERTWLHWVSGIHNSKNGCLKPQSRLGNCWKMDLVSQMKILCEKKTCSGQDTKTGVRSDSLSQYFKEDAQIALDCSTESTNQLIDKEIELVDSKKMETSFFLGSNIFQTLHLIIQEASFKRNWKTYVCYKCAKYASVTCSYNESCVLLLFCSNSAKTGSKCFRTKLFLSNSPLLLCPTFLYFFV